jgi:hypothetical protein
VQKRWPVIGFVAVLFAAVTIAFVHAPLSRPAFAAALPGATSARVFEMRTYTVDAGQLPALLGRFRDHTIEIFNRHGMTSIGYWTPTDSLLSKTTLIYIIAHASREAATQNWAAFRADPEWQKVSAATTAAGLVVRKVESVFLDPTDFSAIK